MFYIEQSFIFLDGVSYMRERALWKQGIHTWDDFLKAVKVNGFSSARKLCADRKLIRAKRLLITRDFSGLASLFPKKEHWRMYDIFKRELIALDIETSIYYGDVTVIGLHDGDDAHFFVKHKNLDLFMHFPLKEQVLLTFNGRSFDVPVLERYFPQLTGKLTTLPHIDLMHVAGRLGYTGGLKKIEQTFAIARNDAIKGMAGGDACMLWELYSRQGDEKALRILLEYNKADVENLFVLAELLIPKLWETVRGPAVSLPLCESI